MPLNMSFVIQFSRSVPRQPRFQRTRDNFKSLCNFLCRRRTMQSISRPTLDVSQSGFADDDSSWLGPPPGYEEDEGAYTCLDAPHDRGSVESETTVFEGVTVLTSATLTGPVDSPATIPTGTSHVHNKAILTNKLR